MSYSEQQHYIILKIKQLAGELGRVPMKHEVTALFNGRVNLDVLFKTYDEAVIAAGISSTAKNKDKNKFRYKRMMVDSFNIVELNLEEQFELNGNPEVLRLVARPDSHIEEEDTDALNIYEQFCEWYEPHIDLVMGDFIGAGGVSHWDAKDLKPKRLVPEIIRAREVLDSFTSATSSTKTRIYLEGNHEDWINQAMIKNMPEMFDGLDELNLSPDLKKLLQLEKYGYELIKLNHILRVGKANFTHGFYTGNNHPKMHLDRFKANIYYGHLHDVKSTHDITIDGMIEAASLGCLCRTDAKFMKGKPTNWVQGWGVFEFKRDGTFHRYQMIIKNKSVSYNGMVFDGN